MAPELLDIQPRELIFTFELKKQSTCSVKLVNNSYQYVAFKVKTTSPKKYCVRPNTGVVQPMSTCDFTVTMQAQREAPPDMQCKDKFLIQSTVVPYGTTEEGVTSIMFSKGNGKYIEESKLKVVLVNPPHFTILLPPNEALKKESEASNVIGQVLNGVEKNSPVEKHSTFEKHSPPHKVGKQVEEMKPAKDAEDLKPATDAEGLKQAKDVVELKPAKNAEWKSAKDVDELKPGKNMELKHDKDVDLKVVSESRAKDVEEPKQAKDVALKLAELKPANNVEANNMEELKAVKDVDFKFGEDLELRLAEDKLGKHGGHLKVTEDVEDLNVVKDMELKLEKDLESKLAKDVEELKSQVTVLESKLSEAEVTITKLRQERSASIEERHTLQHQMAVLRRKNGLRRAQKGFPLLFVCMVTLVGVVVGYLLRSRGSQSV